jgi:unspecific monooxygenase
MSAATLFGMEPPSADYAANPYPALDRLRHEAPRLYVPARDTWFISGHADIASLLRDHRLAITKSSSFADQSPKFRSAVANRLRGMFAPPAPEIRQAVASAVERCVARLAHGREVDLVPELAQALPLRVMADLLGIPPADQPALLRLGEDVLLSYDLDWAGRQVRDTAGAVLPVYFRNHWRHAPDTPLMRLLRDVQSAHGLPDQSLIDTCSKLFVAGTTTTAGCIANILARVVGAAPDSAGVPDIAHGPPVGPAMLDRLLRLDTPVLAVKRVVRDAIPLAGATLAPGQRVALLVAGANRASDSDGDWPMPSLTFGLGRYHCLGAAIARLEISALLDRLLPLVPQMRIVAPVAWRQAWLLHEARSIRVTISEGTDAD